MELKIKALFKPKKVVGLYISQEIVDLVVLKSSLKGPKLVKFGQTHIYPKEKQVKETVSIQGAGGQTNQPGEEPAKVRDTYIIEAIKRVFKENNLRPCNVVTAISSEDAMVRYFQMPKIPKQERQTAVNFEAKRYVPFRMEDVLSDFQIIPSRISPNSMDVVFVAVKRNIIDHYMSIFEAAGVRPILMEPAPFSLMRAFNAGEQINNKINTVIIDLDSKTANINILRNSVPYMIRDVVLSYETQEDENLEPIFEKLLNEIRLSLDFYEKQFPNEIIDKIIIYSRLPLEKWHELVGKELQIPVEVGDPLRGIRIGNNIVPARLAICFGLALRGLSESYIDVNLCKEKLFLYKKKELFLKMLFLEASAAVFLLILLKIAFMRAIVPLTNELERTVSERPKTEVSVKSDNIDELSALKNQMETKKRLLEQMMPLKTYVTPKLADIVNLIPENMWLEEISFEEKIDKRNNFKVTRSLDIKGYYLTDGKKSETDIVNDFLSKLKKSSGINNGMAKADIVSVKKAEIKNKKVSSFEILFTGP